MNHTTRRARAQLLGLVAAAATLAVVAAACGPTLALGQPATRLTPNGPRVFDSADPAVLNDGGTLYLYGSSNNKKLPVRVVESFGTPLGETQTAWAENPIDAMPTRPAWVDASEWEIWAPSVIKLGTTYWVYFAGRRAGATDEVNDQCIGRASARSPMGPFAPESGPIYCGLKKVDAAANWWGHGALDPEVVRDAEGRLHMLVALSRTKGNIGVVRLDSAGKVVGGGNATPTVLVSQSRPWHDGTDDATLNARDAFLENPSMAYDPQTRTYLLFYSAGQWYTARYNTGFARCATPAGPCVVDGRAPFLKGGNGRSGPGGLTAFRDAGGTLRVAYATWRSGYENQVGPAGAYKRQTHWATLSLSSTTDPARQSVTLR